MSSSPSFEKVGECLYRNPSSGTYYALVKVRGKQIKRSLETDNLPEARRLLKEFKNEIERIDPELSKTTLAQLSESFLKTIQHQAPATVYDKTKVLERIRKEWPGGADRPLAKIKPSEAMEFLSQTFPGIASYNRALEVMRPMFLSAVKDKVIARSPLEGVKNRKREKPIRQTPTQDEFQAIVANIRGQRLSDTAKESADLIEFYGLAGMGQAESAALTVSDLSFERSQFITFRQKTREGFAVPIFPQLRPLLERRIAILTKKNNGQSLPPETKVFAVADAKKALTNACKRLNLPNFSSRAFRRMFITTAIERGVDVKVIALWQGHQDGGKLILDTYSHVRPAHSERMAALMTTEKPGNVIEMKKGAA